MGMLTGHILWVLPEAKITDKPPADKKCWGLKK